MRRLLLTAAVATAASVLVGVFSPPASAYVGDPITNNLPWWESTLSDIEALPTTPPATAPWLNPSTGAAVTSTEISQGMSIARIASGAIPAEALLVNGLALGATAYVGVKLGTAAGNFIYKKFVAPSGVAANFKLTCHGSAPGYFPNSQVCSSTTGASFTGFNSGNALCGSGTGALYAQCSGWIFGSATNSQVPGICSTTYCTNYNTLPGIKIFNNANATCFDGTTSITVAAGNCVMTILTEPMLEHTVPMQNSTSTEYGSATSQVDKSNYGYTPSDADATRGANRLCVNGNYSVCTSSENGARVAIQHQLDPSYDPGVGIVTSSGAITTANPIVLPIPELNESVQEWMDRLRARGWYGSATVTTYDGDLVAPGYQPWPNGGPSEPVKITVPLGTIDRTALPSPYFPNSPLSVNPSDAISVQANPDTAPTLVPPGAIDFTPITSVDFGCKFPFGFYCYAQEVTGWFNVTPVAPDFDFQIAKPALAGGGYISTHYNVSLSNMDSYMATFRDLISVVLWIGGVYFVATRLLGFHAGGDVGEAVDDAF